MAWNYKQGIIKLHELQKARWTHYMLHPSLKPQWNLRKLINRFKSENQKSIEHSEEEEKRKKNASFTERTEREKIASWMCIIYLLCVLKQNVNISLKLKQWGRAWIFQSKSGATLITTNLIGNGKYVCTSYVSVLPQIH